MFSKFLLLLLLLVFLIYSLIHLLSFLKTINSFFLMWRISKSLIIRVLGNEYHICPLSSTQHFLVVIISSRKIFCMRIYWLWWFLRWITTHISTHITNIRLLLLLLDCTVVICRGLDQIMGRRSRRDKVILLDYLLYLVTATWRHSLVTLLKIWNIILLNWICWNSTLWL